MKAYNKYEVDEIFSSWQSDLDQLDVIEVYTKSDMVAMLTELKTEIEELDTYDIERVHGLIENGYISKEVEDLIQQRIDKLKEDI